MENNLENKEIFFALYWGQKCAFMRRPHEPEYLEKVSDYSIAWVSYLELKPLSSISDEDASSLRGFINKGDFLFYLRKCKNQYNFIDSNLSLGDLDYLRSKGYALPFHNLSVEDLIRYGWIKLKNGSQ